MKQNKIVENISGIFLPIINGLTAASILKSILTLLVSFHVLNTADGVYRIFYAGADGFFYFLPFYLAMTAAKQWKTDPFISMMIPAAMLYPDLLTLVEEGMKFDFAGIPVSQAIYHSSVIPVLLAVGLLHFVERPCDRYIPEAVRGFLKPMVCCLIVLPATFLVFGPLGTQVGNALTNVFFKIYEWNPVLAGAFMGFLIQPMVVLGAHWSIVPIMINNIFVRGYDIILPLLCGAVYGQAGAALAVGILCRRDKKKSRVAYQASFTAAIGVTEPALYAVSVPNPRAMISGCIAGAVGGIMTGLAGTHCAAFAFPSILTCVAYYGQGFGIFLLTMPVCAGIGFALTMLQGKHIQEANFPQVQSAEEN